MNHVLETALTLHKNNISTVPVKADGTKRPAGNWKHYQNSRATADEIRTWFTADTNLGIGVVTGTISGNLEMLELEGRAAARLVELKQLAEDSGLGDLFTRVLRGWFEQSPSGGWHIFYRTTDPTPGNTKLAANLARETLAETRGEGGFVVIAPSAGTVHTSGKPWKRITGGPDTVPTITTAEREALHALFATLHEHQPEPAAQAQLEGFLGGQENSSSGGLKPGDDYENKTDWADILKPAGWTLVFTRGRTRYWRRPDKTDPGFSATTGHADDRDRLYVFTTSTEFESEKPYTKFGAYALLTHNGDHSAAASQLRTDGYGKEPERTVTAAPKIETPRPSSDTPPATDGTAALAPVHNLDDHRAATTTVEYSDDGNALALIDTYGDRLRYCPDRGRWLAWDGTRWQFQPAGGGQARELAKGIARGLNIDDHAARTHRKKTLSAKGITDMLIQAQTDHRITVGIDELDAKPWELNTPGGIINLRTGKLTASDPAQLHTKTTSCTPDFDAESELWEDFLDTTFGQDDELTGYMQRLVGYSTVGEVRDHVFPFAYGSGGNGKSAFFDTMIAILGDYGTSTPNGFLMASNYAAHTTEIARLKGARFVVCEEVNESDRFDEAKVKQLTGGNTLTARFMRQDDFTFAPTHHLWLAGNFQPAVESGGDSFWRRLRLIPFTNTVPKEQQIDGLKEVFAREHGPAILAWVARGAAEYAADGLKEPAMVKAATQEYAADVDTVGRFLAEECEILTNYRPGMPATAVTAIRSAYERWCNDNGETPIKGRHLSTQLQRHGVATGRNVPKGAGGTRLYGGIRILSDQPEIDLHDGDRGGY